MNRRMFVRAIVGISLLPYVPAEDPEVAMLREVLRQLEITHARIDAIPLPTFSTIGNVGPIAVNAEAPPGSEA